METLKPWHHSKTVWGSLIALAATIAAAFGIDIDGDAQTALVEVILQLVTVGGSLMAVFGRISATTMIE